MIGIVTVGQRFLFDANAVVKKSMGSTNNDINLIENAFLSAITMDINQF